ncbi:MAG: hypothetical protein QXS54_11395, partial [Candidatus Methanomethylicaceae archaeon]
MIYALLVLLFATAASANQQLTWHLGGDSALSTSGSIVSMEADNNAVYLAVRQTNDHHIVKYDPSTKSLSRLYTAPGGCQAINALRLFRNNLYFVEKCGQTNSIKALRFDFGDTLGTPMAVGSCIDPWDMHMADSGAIVACMSSHSVQAVDRFGLQETIIPYRSGRLCDPTSTLPSFIGPRSLDVDGSALYLVSLGCGLLLEYDLTDKKFVRTIAGKPWAQTLGELVPGRTNANGVSMPISAVRKLGDYLLVGLSLFGAVTIDKRTSVVDKLFLTGKTPSSAYDSYAVGHYVAYTDRHVWVAGLKALASFDNPYFHSPLDTPTALPQATPTPVSRACDLAREL